MIIRKGITWSMGHALIDYEGLCKHLHGHQFQAWFEYEGDMRPDGMVVDTGIFKEMQVWVDENWDHKTLLHHDHLALKAYVIGITGAGQKVFSDDIIELGFEAIPFNPTSENIAKFLHKVASGRLGLNPQKLSVTVIETPTINVTFRGADL